MAMESATTLGPVCRACFVRFPQECWMRSINDIWQPGPEGSSPKMKTIAQVLSKLACIAIKETDRINSICHNCYNSIEKAQHFISCVRENDRKWRKNPDFTNLLTDTESAFPEKHDNHNSKLESRISFVDIETPDMGKDDVYARSDEYEKSTAANPLQMTQPDNMSNESVFWPKSTQGVSSTQINETVFWPPPLRVEKCFGNVMNGLEDDIEVKQEVMSDEEYTRMSCHEEIDIKVEPEEFIKQEVTPYIPAFAVEAFKKRLYRQRMKLFDPERWQQYLKKNREALRRKRAMLDERARELVREKDRLRARKRRQNLDERTKELRREKNKLRKRYVRAMNKLKTPDIKSSLGLFDINTCKDADSNFHFEATSEKHNAYDRIPNETSSPSQVFKDVRIEVKQECDEGAVSGEDLPLGCMLCTKNLRTISGLKAHVIAFHSYNDVKRKPKEETLLVETNRIRRRNHHSNPIVKKPLRPTVRKQVTQMHPCSHCGLTFHTKTKLRTHTRLYKRTPSLVHSAPAPEHSTDKPKTVQQLRRASTISENIEVKIDTRHTNPCELCKKTFATRDNLNIHNQIKHQNNEGFKMDVEVLEDFSNESDTVDSTDNNTHSLTNKLSQDVETDQTKMEGVDSQDKAKTHDVISQNESKGVNSPEKPMSKVVDKQYIFKDDQSAEKSTNVDMHYDCKIDSLQENVENTAHDIDSPENSKDFNSKTFSSHKNKTSQDVELKNNDVIPQIASEESSVNQEQEILRENNKLDSSITPDIDITTESILSDLNQEIDTKMDKRLEDEIHFQNKQFQDNNLLSIVKDNVIKEHNKMKDKVVIDANFMEIEPISVHAVSEDFKEIANSDLQSETSILQAKNSILYDANRSKKQQLGLQSEKSYLQNKVSNLNSDTIVQAENSHLERKNRIAKDLTEDNLQIKDSHIQGENILQVENRILQSDNSYFRSENTNIYVEKDCLVSESEKIEHNFPEEELL